MKEKYNELTYKELVVKKNELSDKYRKARFDSVLGHNANPLLKRNLRRDISTINTLIHEYKLGIRK